MKVKVGDMDIEGTPEECKAFLKNLEDATIHSAPNSPLSNVPNRKLEKVVPSQDKIEDNIHTQIKKEIEKDYEN